MSRRRRLLSIAWKVLAILLVLLIYAAWPGRQTFTVSPETTYVIGPLDKDGYVDYVTALNERLSKGITPEKNANVLIWEALGPHPDGATMPEEYFKWLGMDLPPERGEYFLGSTKYVKKLGRDTSFIEGDEFHEQLAAARIRPWTEKEFPEVADWLKQNEKPLAVLTEASKRPEYFSPGTPKQTADWSPGLIGSLLPTMQPCRDVAQAFAARAMLFLQEGRPDDAWQDLLACWRLGRLIGHGPCIIEALVSYAIDHVASRTATAFVFHAKLTSGQLAACAEDVRKIMSPISRADKIELGERILLLDVMMQVIRQGTPFLEAIGNESTSRRPEGSKYLARLFERSIDWDPAFRVGNHWYDRLAAIMRLESRTEREAELTAIETDLVTLKHQVKSVGVERLFMGPSGRGEWMGNLLTASFIPALQKLNSAADRHEQTHRNLRLAFALAAFHADTGRYPAKLDELAPKYLDTIPNDLFSDKPLIYKPEGKGYLLYSVGANGVDDEGRTVDDQPQGDDIAVRMPPPRE